MAMTTLYCTTLILVNAGHLLCYPLCNCLGTISWQCSNSTVDMFQQMIPVQQIAVSGKHLCHLLGNPGGPISYSMHPCVISIAPTECQGKHLLSYPWWQTQHCCVPPFILLRKLHRAQTHFLPLSLTPPLWRQSFRTQPSLRV